MCATWISTHSTNESSTGFASNLINKTLTTEAWTNKLGSTLSAYMIASSKLADTMVTFLVMGNKIVRHDNFIGCINTINHCLCSDLRSQFFSFCLRWYHLFLKNIYLMNDEQKHCRDRFIMVINTKSST